MDFLLYQYNLLPLLQPLPVIYTWVYKKSSYFQIYSGLSFFLTKKSKTIDENIQIEETIKVPDLTEAAVYKLRKHVEQIDDTGEEDEDIGDDFENLYKGEISKSGVPILPSKRARKIPEKIQVSKDDLEELQNSTETPMSDPIDTNEESGDASLEEMQEEENLSNEQDPNNQE